MSMQEKLVVKELEQGKELANQLMTSLNNPSSSSKESNEVLISEILRCFENTIATMMNLDNKTLKRSQERSDQSNKKRRRMWEKNNTEKVKVCVGTEQEGTPLDDGHSWRKYGQKDIHGSKNPRGYYRCTHRFTRGCLAVKQVQKSDTNPLCYEVKYVESHTCELTPSTTNHSVSVSKEEEKLQDAKQYEDTMKHMKPEELMLSVEDLDYKKEIFRTFSFKNPEIDGFLQWSDLMENLSPTTSESGITTNEFQVSPTDESCFSSLENILGSTPDLSWM